MIATRLARLSATVAISLVATASVAQPEPDNARVQFDNSCNAEVQALFSDAITLLHSFEYNETKRMFGEIIREDPGCAIAQWGVAMSIWHPLWSPPDSAGLAEGAKALAAARTKLMTSREAAYVDALQAFFSSTDPQTHAERVRAYEAKMSEVYATWLDDPEAAMFYALALLAAADPRDKSYARQYKAAALLNWVRESQPLHPGALHYLIHAYDYPELAHLALPAATVYAGAAPDSAHAQHMPSHIFTRLGLWDRSLASNEDSTQSAAEYTQRAHLDGHYDEGLHSMDYLMYALLQTARDAEAKELLATLDGIDKTDTENFKVAYTYTASPARYALERRQWREASQLELIREDFPWADFGWAQSIHYFARGIGAARAGDVDAAGRELAAIERLQADLPATTLPYWKEQVQVHIDAVGAWIAYAEGRTEEALSLALRAADLEDAVDKHPVTPGEVLPARELYADMLFEAGRFDESRTQYEIVLTRAPNRLNALLGAANAAAQSGDTDAAQRYRAIVRDQTSSGNRAGLTS
jgi:hypothetical protein